MSVLFFITHTSIFNSILAKLCQDREGCEYWSWIDPFSWDDNSGSNPIQNHCFLKNGNAIDGRQPLTGVISGSKGCQGNYSGST